MSLVTQMRCFKAVCETGGFKAASRLLSMNQSTVSRHIANLEQHLQVTLVYRSTRMITPTSEGENYLQYCDQILSMIEDAERNVQRNDAANLQGKIRLTCPVSLASDVIAPAVAEFSAEFKQVEVEVVATDSRIDLIANGIDIAIRGGTHESLGPSTNIAQKISDVNFVCVGTPDYFKDAAEPQHPMDLMDELAVGYSIESPETKWTYLEDKIEKKVKLKTLHSATNLEVVRTWARLGLGLACIPLFVAKKEIETGHLKIYCPATIWEKNALFLLAPNQKVSSKRNRLMWDFLKQKIPKMVT